MPPPEPPAPDLADWPSLLEASQHTGRSVRSLQRAIAAGDIQHAQRNRPGKRPETVIHPADVERLAAARAPAPILAPLPRGSGLGSGLASGQASALTLAGPGTPHPLALQLAIAAAALTRQQPAPLPLWLSLQEASTYSGLSQTLLRHLAQSGAIPSLRDGRKLKFHRAALDNWACPPTHQPPKSTPSSTRSISSSAPLTSAPKKRR